MAGKGKTYSSSRKPRNKTERNSCIRQKVKSGSKIGAASKACKIKRNKGRK